MEDSPREDQHQYNKERTEEASGLYAKEDCFILAGMGKYVPVQMNCEIKGEVLIEISDKTIHGLIYRVSQKQVYRVSQD